MPSSASWATGPFQQEPIEVAGTWATTPPVNTSSDQNTADATDTKPQSEATDSERYGGYRVLSTLPSAWDPNPDHE